MSKTETAAAPADQEEKKPAHNGHQHVPPHRHWHRRSHARKHPHPAVRPPEGADIPQLQKLPTKAEKERKRSGAFWNGARGAGSTFGGTAGSSTAANVMTRLAAEAAEAAAEAAGEAAGAAPAAGIGAAYEAAGSFSAAWLALAAAGGLLAGTVVLNGGLPGWMRASGDALARFAGRLSPISSTIKARSAGDSASLYYAGRAAKGELRFAQPWNAPAGGQPGAGAAAGEGQKVGEGAKVGEGRKVGEGEKVPSAPVDWGSVLAQAGAPSLPHDLAAARLTTNFGGSGSIFAGKNIFGGGGAPQFGSALGNLGLPPLASRASMGKLGAFSHFSIPLAKSGYSQKLGISQRAMGQLKLARTLSVTAGSVKGAEAGKTLAADAFDQRITEAPNPPQSPMDGPVDKQPVPLGGGAPDITQPTESAPPTEVTPWQQPFNQAQDQAKQAGSNKLMSIILMILGIGLIIAGIALMSHCWCAGLALIIAGLALVMQSIMKLTQAQGNAAQAKQLASQIQQQNGQQVPAQRLNECADSALQSGNCQATTQPPNVQTNTKKAADTEGNSTYEIQPGQPVQ